MYVVIINMRITNTNSKTIYAKWFGQRLKIQDAEIAKYRLSKS